VDSILRQQFQDFEIVVLDDASDGIDSARQLASALGDVRIRPYRSDSPRGVAGGRNFLMSQARGRLLAFLDDDAIFVRDDAVEKVVATFSSYPAAAALAFNVENVVERKRQPNLPASGESASRCLASATESTLVSYFVGCGHAIRKGCLAACGDYRPDMTFGEDELDLSYRFIHAGHQIVFVPSVAVEHTPQPSVVGGTPERRTSELFFHIRNRVYLAYRYLPWRYVVPYLGIWMSRYAARAVRHNDWPDFIRGALAAPDFVRGVRREVLNRSAIAYLSQHGGRLWY
jgi:GT2 family glycosyltransferase